MWCSKKDTSNDQRVFDRTFQGLHLKQNIQIRIESERETETNLLCRRCSFSVRFLNKYNFNLAQAIQT